MVATLWKQTNRPSLGISGLEESPFAMALLPPPLRDAHTAGLARYRATGEGRLLGKLIEIRSSQLVLQPPDFPLELGDPLVVVLQLQPEHDARVRRI